MEALRSWRPSLLLIQRRRLVKRDEEWDFKFFFGGKFRSCRPLPSYLSLTF
jgi:hypothetical protein